MTPIAKSNPAHRAQWLLGRFCAHVAKHTGSSVTNSNVPSRAGRVPLTITGPNIAGRAALTSGR